ncbi:unnamed protein product [Periconia digitata]|uniref:Uncharacterized protein n=1 Tax=Periconia digitata TaxID=1303443 RepID=A0A9W4UNL7_9PLEO|nr:unnamed protein product [Periconia digitata]
MFRLLRGFSSWDEVIGLLLHRAVFVYSYFVAGLSGLVSDHSLSTIDDRLGGFANAK